jgi:hypothetical protein
MKKKPLGSKIIHQLEHSGISMKRKSRSKPSTEEPLSNTPESEPNPSNPLDGLEPAELIALSDIEFQGHVRRHARSKAGNAMATIEEVMNTSDDDQARILAATKMLKIAKAEEEEKGVIMPFSISPEVLAIALEGLGKLARIAGANAPQAILRDVTPASSDPRPFIADDSPLNKPLSIEQRKKFDEEILIEENLQE